jgi:hypothetical protein
MKGDHKKTYTDIMIFPNPKRWLIARGQKIFRYFVITKFLEVFILMYHWY